MALPSAASTDKAQAPSLDDGTTPSPVSPTGDNTQKLPAPLEWAVISVDSITSETNVSDAAARQAKALVSLDSPASLPSEQSWQERDSGMEPQATAERAGEGIALVLLSLMDQYRVSLGITPNSDNTKGAVGRLSSSYAFF